MTEEQPEVLKDSGGLPGDSDDGPIDQTDVSDLSAEDAQLIAKLQEMGCKRVSMDDDGLTIMMPSNRGVTLTSRAIPLSSIPDLRLQLSWNFSEHPQYAGYIAPELGLVEIGLQKLKSLVTPQRLSTLAENSISACIHAREGSWIPIVPRGGLSRWSNADGDSRHIPSRIHLTRRDGNVCLELSNPSPLAVPYVLRAPDHPEYSLKFYFQDRLSSSEMVERSENILQAFLYELNIRNGLVFAAIRWPLAGDPRSSRKEAGQSEVASARFPVTVIQPEVAKLFNFASQASGNLPLAFLSYYQTLEYFLFAMVRRGVVRAVRDELLDSKFDERSDTSLMGLIGIVERSIGTIESKQLRLLLNEGVREDRVKQFLAGNAWGNHFTRQGPIQGVPPLLLKDGSAGILDQVADRVYKIRNRIVHAKDDPKYGEVKVLLPESREADSLGPDVQLVRLLSMEVILESQGR